MAVCGIGSVRQKMFPQLASRSPIRFVSLGDSIKSVHRDSSILSYCLIRIGIRF